MIEAGTCAFMLVCTMLVFLMTPGLAFFYGGLSRRKNVVNTMSMVFLALGLVGVAWIVCGWSFAYGGDGTIPFFGGIDQIGCMNIASDLTSGQGESQADATYPKIVDVGFQMAFAMITASIITGAVAGRMRFSALCAFLVIWVCIIYAPLAHMVWGGEGSLIGDIIGALDFAGGDVVHISSGLTGLVLCIMIGRRKEFAVLNYRPHNVPFVVLGVTLLWFGWFGFNSGSAFAPDGIAALALLNTAAASAAGLLAWIALERIITGKPTLVGAATGLVAGLVAITPAAGFVEPWAAIAMGAITAPICYLAISKAKRKIGYDDALDAFGCHCVGGIVGGILTGVFCVPELSWTGFGGLIYTGDATLLIAQLLGIMVTIAFVCLGSILIGLLVRAVFRGRIRVTSEEESMGLDISEHGESAYPAFVGMD